MAPDRSKSRKAKEPVGLWRARIERWKRNWEQLRPSREALGAAVDLDLPAVAPPSADPTIAYQQTEVYWIARAHDMYLAQLYDARPEIRVKRTGENESEYAEFQEVLLDRAADQAGMPQRFRHVESDALWAGFGCIWFGIDVLPALETTQQGAKGAGDITEEVLTGTHEPHAAQDHATVSGALDALADSTLEGGSLDADQHDAVVTASAAHQLLEIEEAEDPAPAWDIEKGTAWARVTPPGDAAWSGLSTDIRDSWWAARKVMLAEDDAKAMGVLRRTARAKLKPQSVYEEKPQVQGSRVKADGLDTAKEDAENGLVVLWEIWDARNKTRHYINDFVDEYLEVDETYPYLDAKGDVGIEGFFPFAPCVPKHPTTKKPIRAFGVPPLAAGLPLQLEAVKFMSKMVSGAKATNRVTLFDPRLPADSKTAITSGTDLNGVEGAEGVDIDKQVYNVPIPPVPIDWKITMEVLKSTFFEGVGISAAQFTQTGVSDTATESENIEQSAQVTFSDMGAQVEWTYARGCRILRDLIRVGYPNEKVAQLVGQTYVNTFEAWKQTSTAGDTISVRLASRSRDEDPLAIQQLTTALEMVVTLVDDETGLPIAPPRTKKRLVKELFRRLGAGDLEEWTEEEIRTALANRMAMAAAAGPGQKPGGKPGGGHGGGGPRPSQPQSRGEMAGASRNVPMGNR